MSLGKFVELEFNNFCNSFTEVIREGSKIVCVKCKDCFLWIFKDSLPVMCDCQKIWKKESMTCISLYKHHKLDLCKRTLSKYDKGITQSIRIMICNCKKTRYYDSVKMLLDALIAELFVISDKISDYDYLKISNRLMKIRTVYDLCYDN